ncbi:hypothetical protein L3Q82_014361 [Scortum barcoo]|uniref:Uncharacterized protein n=1 Tax=Scortum barcoo TaxID=214431 RepID=A0ACB8VX56_9TELE|nr:hypothetical protein L3Q82_014361 [Scortum barcoo]
MALSQIQCLDDNHVNPRINESKPDFLYSEDQRLALEALLRDGREAFFKFLEARGLRGFLSDPELDALSAAVQPYEPGCEPSPGGAEDDEPPLSLHYWPELSDTSVPQMDLGWPDCEAYRGVTRTTVYSQPPLDGQTHIKEVVRKMIAQAQKVIAVVMDIFTDVDIFRDLLDAGYKRKVSVYILLERTTLPHFLSMCQRANMHVGHLKHLRVRCTEGVEFYTRSSTKVRGRMGHKFMFIDGDKAMSGSYSFTWTSSRLERNLVTVVTGQAVDAFDRLFRILYASSSSADLRQVATNAEPEPEPVLQPAAVAPPSAALARKLYNPKYALVTLGNPNPSPSSPPEHNSPKETQNPEVPDTKKRRRRRASIKAMQEAPPIHPGLTNLEKACLLSYLPTWPEPDPPSDVIGFINIRDSKKPNQVHLQRSEMFETSQAIRFSSPFTMPEKPLPEVATPRQLIAKHEEVKKLQPAQDKTKAEESTVDRAQPAALNEGSGDIESKAVTSDKGTTKTLNAKNKLHSNTPANQDAGQNTTPHLSAHTPPQSSSKAPIPSTGSPSHPKQTVTTNNPEPASLPKSNAEEAETSLNTPCAAVYRTHTLESNSAPTDSNIGNTQKKTSLPCTDSHTVHTQPQTSTEMTPNIQTPNLNSPVSSTSVTSPQPASPTSVSENNHVSITTSTNTSACAPLSSTSSSPSLLPLTSSSTTLSPPLPSSTASSPLTPAPPIPKPRTIQLVIKKGITSDGRNLPEFSVVMKPEADRRPPMAHNDPAAATVLENEPETVPEQQNKSESTTGAQKEAESAGCVGEAPQQEQFGTSQETKNEEAVGPHDDRVAMQSVTGTNPEAESDVSITDSPKEESLNIQEIIPKDLEPETLISISNKVTPQMETRAPEKTPGSCESAEVPNEISKDVTQHKAYRARAHELQRIYYSELTPQDMGVLETVDPSETPTHTPVSATHDTHSSNDGAVDAVLTFKAQGGKKKPLHLHLPDTHLPDLHSPKPERESRLLAALMRTPTPDGLLPHTPTSDSRTHTPDPRSYTPDFFIPRRPMSATGMSPLSPPPQKSIMNVASLLSTSLPSTERLTATMVQQRIMSTSSSETQTLSGPASVSSPSSSLERKVKTGEEEEAQNANEENVREEDERVNKVNAAGRRGSEEAKRTADHFRQGKDSRETVEKNKEAQPQAPKRKRVLNQSAVERLVDGEITNEGAEQQRLSRGDLKPKKVSAAGERRDRSQSGRETEAQKLLNTPSRTPRGQQQNSGSSSPSRPSRPPRPLSANQAFGPRPWVGRQLSEAEGKALQGSFPFLDNSSSLRRPPSRPPPPTASGRQPAEDAHSHQSLLSRPPLTAQGRARAGQSLNQHLYPKPQASQLRSHSQNQTSPTREAHCQEEGKGPFSFTFSRLYNLKGLKDKITRLPPQSRRGSTSSPVQGRKSTSYYYRAPERGIQTPCRRRLVQVRSAGRLPDVHDCSISLSREGGGRAEEGFGKGGGGPGGGFGPRRWRRRQRREPSGAGGDVEGVDGDRDPREADGVGEDVRPSGGRRRRRRQNSSGGLDGEGEDGAGTLGRPTGGGMAKTGPFGGRRRQGEDRSPEPSGWRRRRRPSGGGGDLRLAVKAEPPREASGRRRRRTLEPSGGRRRSSNGRPPLVAAAKTANPEGGKAGSPSGRPTAAYPPGGRRRRTDPLGRPDGEDGGWNLWEADGEGEARNPPVAAANQFRRGVGGDGRRRAAEFGRSVDGEGRTRAAEFRRGVGGEGRRRATEFGKSVGGEGRRKGHSVSGALGGSVSGALGGSRLGSWAAG